MYATKVERFPLPLALQILVSSENVLSRQKSTERTCAARGVRAEEAATTTKRELPKGARPAARHPYPRGTRALGEPLHAEALRRASGGQRVVLGGKAKKRQTHSVVVLALLHHFRGREAA